MVTLAWTLIAVVGLVIALGVLADTLRHFLRFRKERPELVGAYWIEVVQDLAITVVQSCYALLGAIAMFRTDATSRGVLVLMLFAGPVVLTLASLNHYWSRRRL